MDIIINQERLQMRKQTTMKIIQDVAKIIRLDCTFGRERIYFNRIRNLIKIFNSHPCEFDQYMESNKLPTFSAEKINYVYENIMDFMFPVGNETHKNMIYENLVDNEIDWLILRKFRDLLSVYEYNKAPSGNISRSDYIIRQNDFHKIQMDSFTFKNHKHDPSNQNLISFRMKFTFKISRDRNHISCKAVIKLYEREIGSLKNSNLIGKGNIYTSAKYNPFFGDEVKWLLRKYSYVLFMERMRPENISIFALPYIGKDWKEIFEDNESDIKLG